MSAPPVTTPPKPAIRALIADYTPDPPTVNQTADRDLIAKVIRQGGRRVWLDVSYVDSAAVEWLAQILNVSAALLALDAPFYEREPFLVFGLPVPFSSAEGEWGFNTALIAIRGTMLLSLSHGTEAWADVFLRAERHLPDWQANFNETVYELLTALVKVVEQTSNAEVGRYVSVSQSLLSPPPTGYVSDFFNILRLFQSSARQLHDRSESAGYTLSTLGDHPAFESDQDMTWKLFALADRWDANVQRLSRSIEDSHNVFGTFTAQQTAQMNTRIRGITIALFIALPILVATLWALILPVSSTDVRLVAWAVVMIAAVGLSLALGARAKIL